MLFLSATACSYVQRPAKAVVIQPMGNCSQHKAALILQQISSVNPNTVTRRNMSLPHAALHASRNRYSADSLIRILQRGLGDDSVIIAVLNEDTATKNKIKDRGVMGLGFRPGKACKVSTFRPDRAKRKEQLYKVMLHGSGHTEGLDHSPQNTCLLRYAEGGNPLDQKKRLCLNCKRYLKAKGGTLP